METSAIVDTWHIHNRINLYMLDAIDEAHLFDVASSKGRNVGEQWAHLHNVRLMWLQAARPALLEGLVKLEKEAARSKELLRGSNSFTQAPEFWRWLLTLPLAQPRVC